MPRVFLAVLSCCSVIAMAVGGDVMDTRFPRQAQLDCSPLVALEILRPVPDCSPALTALGGITDYVANYGRVIELFQTICRADCFPTLYNFTLLCLRASAPALALACASNEQAVPCYAAVATNNGTEILTYCSASSVSSGSGSGMPTQEVSETPTPPVCSAECSGAIQRFRRDIGCCVNNAFNTTAFGLMSFGFADYTLWSSCGVPPLMFCPNPLMIPTQGPTISGGSRAVLNVLVPISGLSLLVFAILM